MISTSNLRVIPWTALKRGTSMTQARALAKHCTHGVLYQPRAKAAIVLGVHDDPWHRLGVLLDRIPNGWPRDGWILLQTVMCKYCGETRLIEIQQSHKGQIVLCAVCGRDAPLASATPSARTSGK